MRVLPLAPAAILLFASSGATQTKPFCSVTAPDGTVVELRIDEPLPGSAVDAPPCARDIDVAGVASTIGIPPLLDIVFIIDRSGSTGGGILDDEVAAVREIIRAVSPSHVRAGIISFSSAARLDVSLTDDFAAVEAALDFIQRAGSGGSTYFTPALRMLREEYRLNGDPARSSISLFLSDGWNGGTLASVEVEAAKAATDGLRIDSFGVGPAADPVALRRMADLTGGIYTRLLDPKDILVVLPQVVLVGIDHVEITNLTTGDFAEVRPNLDGTFSMPMPIELGLNELEVVAVADDVARTEVSCGTGVALACTTPPAFSAFPSHVTVECDAVPPATALTAVDVCGRDVPVTFLETRTPGRCGDEYTLERTWTATDDCGNTATHIQVVSVVDTRPPVLAFDPPDVRAACDAVPPPAVLSATDSCDPAPAVAFDERRIDGDCPGEYTLIRTWSATDRCGNGAAVDQVVEVDDDTAPEVAATADDAYALWPPNHWYVCFDRSDFAPAIADDCSEPTSWRFDGCASDQPDDAPDPSAPGFDGDGHTRDDCVVLPAGDGICVRAERAGDGPGAQEGRRYAVSIVASDACGNAAAPTVIGSIHVPHDRSPWVPAIDATARGCRPNQALPCR